MGKSQYGWVWILLLVAGCAANGSSDDRRPFDGGLSRGVEDAGGAEGADDGGSDPDGTGTDGGTDTEPTDAGADAGTADASTGGGEDGGPADAGMDDPDGSTMDGGSEPDGGPVDSGPIDGGTDAGPIDGGLPDIVIDGVVMDGEWAGAEVVSTSVESNWSATNRLERLRATVRDGSLWIAVEGAVETTNAINVYVDGVLDGTDGACDMSTLTDEDGALDNRLSADFDTPAGFCVDLGFSTRSLDHQPADLADFDDTAGWRSFTTVTDFAWIETATAPSACTTPTTGTPTCETRIPLGELGAGSGDTIALFARITNMDGAMSPNQTLPEDAPETPRIVRELLTISLP